MLGVVLRWALGAALAAVVAGVAVAAATWYMAAATAGYRFDAAASVPEEQVAIVFGAGVRPDGRLSRMLADRVRAAAELYRAGRVGKLLMTGDNSSEDYDEVTAMKGYAVELGVPADDVALDYAGFSTYESCYRAGPIFGVTRAVLVTQRYHLPRAVYTCRALGVDAVGLGTPDWEAYPQRVMLPYALRESLATVKALWELHITRPAPTFLGPYVGLG